MPRDLRLRLLIAFAAVYVIWGSTYLAIRVAIDTIPPFAMAASRFLVAGAILVGWARYRGTPLPTRAQWRTALIIGTLMLVGGNGGVVWAETRVTSGLTALIVGAEPLWAVLLDWARPAGHRPTVAVGLGMLTGFAGVALLIAPADLGGDAIDPLGAAVLIVACITWAIGSIYSRHVDTPRSSLMATGANMLSGGLGLVVASAIGGEFARLDLAAVSARSFAAWAYLVVFGAIAGFTAYTYLLQHTTLARASTYAYVNPVVAVFLGWLILREPVGPRTIAAAAVIVAGVVMISTLPWLLERRRAAALAALAKVPAAA